MKVSWLTATQWNRSALALAGIALGIAGCGRPQDDGGIATNRPTGPAASAVRTEVVKYKLTGEVRKVDREASEVTIRHDAIPGFMDAMTMPFHVDDKAELEDVRAGDQVEGALEVTREGERTKSYRLHDLNVTRPALAPPMQLNISGSGVQVGTRPKRLKPGEAVPDFVLTGQDGKEFKLSDLRGQVVVLTFIYTRCPLPDYCPAMDRRFADLAANIAGIPARADRIRLISISFDPEHDTPEVLRKHAQIRGAIPPLWSFAVASHPTLQQVGPMLGLVYGPGKNEIIHNLCTAVIDPEGKLARLETGTESNKWTSADLLKTIYSLIPASKK